MPLAFTQEDCLVPIDFNESYVAGVIAVLRLAIDVNGP